MARDWTRITPAKPEESEDVSKHLSDISEQYWRLEGRVYTLEQDMRMVVNIAALCSVVVLYFAYEYYKKNFVGIPGVLSEH